MASAFASCRFQPLLVDRRHHAAIDPYIGARDEAGSSAGEERYRIGNIGRSADPASR